MIARRDALTEIYRTRRRLAYSIALAVLRDHDRAEDVTHEVFLRALRHLDVTQNAKCISGWITTTAQRCAIDALRKASAGIGKRTATEDVSSLDVPTSWDPPDVQVEQAEELERLRAAIRRLDPPDRTVLEDYHMIGATFADVARSLGCSESTARARVRRAEHHLRRILAAHPSLASV